MGRPKGQSTMESWMIANGKVGEHFYSDKIDRHLDGNFNTSSTQDCNRKTDYNYNRRQRANFKIYN